MTIEDFTDEEIEAMQATHASGVLAATRAIAYAGRKWTITKISGGDGIHTPVGQEVEALAGEAQLNVFQAQQSRVLLLAVGIQISSETQWLFACGDDQIVAADDIEEGLAINRVITSQAQANVSFRITRIDTIAGFLFGELERHDKRGA